MNRRFNEWLPSALPNRMNSFIAPYWADFDLTATGNVFYRQSRNPLLLARATNELQAAFPMSQNVFVINLLIVTWDAVGYYSLTNGTDRVGSCVMLYACMLFAAYLQHLEL